MVITKSSTLGIIICEKPTKREIFASEELFKYLKAIFGKDAEIGKKGDVTFYIGGPSRCEAVSEYISREEFSSLLCGEEGIFIDITDTSVIIAGSEDKDDKERGTLYALYEFLERYLGCTLGAYSHASVDAGEIVPAREELALENGRYIKSEADRPYRTAIVEYGDKAGRTEHELNIPFFDFLIKNRYNRLLIWTKTYEDYKKLGLVEELERRGLCITVGHHDAIKLWLPFAGNEYFKEEYSKTHPEFYRLEEDGTRFCPADPDSPFGQWVFCSREAAAIEEVSKNISTWLSQNTAVDCIALWPMDGRGGNCACEKCKPYKKVENYLYFINEVAKRVGRVYPHVKFDVLLYVDLWELPEGLTLEKNIILDESTWPSAGLRSCGKTDGSCLLNTHMDENLQKWRKATGATAVFYEYYMGVFSNRQRVIPMADEIQSIWRGFIERDFAGAGTQMECFHIWNHLLNLYTFGRTAYNVSLSIDDNINALCRLFGEGANDISLIMKKMEAVVDGQATVQHSGKYFINNIDADEFYALFESAFESALDKRCRNNIRLLRMAFRYSDLEVKDSFTEVRKNIWDPVFDYEDKTGELAYMAQNFDSFINSSSGYGIAMPISNTDTKGFVPDKWYIFE